MDSLLDEYERYPQINDYCPASCHGSHLWYRRIINDYRPLIIIEAIIIIQNLNDDGVAQYIILRTQQFPQSNNGHNRTEDLQK